MRYAIGLIKRFLSCNICMISAGVLLAEIGFIWGYAVQDFTAFQRTGALLVSIGIVSLSRAFISQTEVRGTVLDENGKNIFSREKYVESGESIPSYVLDQEKNLAAIGSIGPWMSFAGTIVCGFGDLLNKLFHFVHG